MLCVFGVVLTFVAVFKYCLVFSLFFTVHCKTNFLVNLYWDNNHSDSDSKACYHNAQVSTG